MKSLVDGLKSGPCLKQPAASKKVKTEAKKKQTKKTKAKDPKKVVENVGGLPLPKEVPTNELAPELFTRIVRAYNQKTGKCIEHEIKTEKKPSVIVNWYERNNGEAPQTAKKEK